MSGDDDRDDDHYRKNVNGNTDQIHARRPKTK